MVALRSVVVDHVQDYFEAGAVQGPHHVLEFRHLIAGGARGGEARVGCEESQRVVAPVIGKAALQEMPIRYRMMYRHQLD